MSSDLAPHALAPGTQIRDYTIVSVIGTGGFSIVYKAIDNSLDRAVAIKEYFPGSFALRDNDGSVRPHSRDSAMFSKGIESFLNEGKLLAAFDHPALVRVYRCWEERGTAYLAMRLYAGTTLRDAVKAGDWHTDEATLAALLRPICNALDVLHAARCYHRDVAPDNIMLIDAGSRLAPVLLDFGAARKAIESTQVFTAILKPGYAPIEQYGDGELKQGPWTDIYALAGVVHFTLSGNAPPTAISRMLKDAMPRPRDAFVGRLPEPWLDAIEAALAVKPERRPQSITEFVALFDWDTTQENMTTVVVAPPHKLAPAAPVIAPLALPDDESTVVMPRRDLDAQIAAKNVQKKPAPIAEPQPEITPTLTAPPEAAPAKSRSMVWLAGAAAVIAAAALVWKLTAGPAVAPLVTPTTDAKRIEPASPPANDTSADKKTSLPSDASPKPVIAAPEPVAPSLVTTPPKTTVTESAPSSASAAKAKVVAKDKAKASRPDAANAANASNASNASSASNAGEGEDNTPAPAPAPARANASKRPARCEVLIERFGLGEAPSAADQRFFQESCK